MERTGSNKWINLQMNVSTAQQLCRLVLLENSHGSIPDVNLI